jgi:hypothetical protein
MTFPVRIVRQVCFFSVTRAPEFGIYRALLVIGMSWYASDTKQRKLGANFSDRAARRMRPPLLIHISTKTSSRKSLKTDGAAGFRIGTSFALFVVVEFLVVPPRSQLRVTGSVSSCVSFPRIRCEWESVVGTSESSKGELTLCAD